MKIWIITWRQYDHSGSGVLSTAYPDEATARHVFDVLVAQCDTKLYDIEELTVVRFPPVSQPAETVKPLWCDTPWRHLIGVPGTPLSTLDLTIRSQSCLTAEGLETVEQLLTCKESTLLKFPNLGRKSLNEIKSALEAKGMSLS